MVSPFVRRHRLAAELVALRKRSGRSAAQLAEAVDVSRQTISRLENGHVTPDLNVVMRILDHFSVKDPQWSNTLAIARDAQSQGWWARHVDQMGPRQARYADLEAGAAQIREYQLTHLPGLLQIPSYTEARFHADRASYPETFDPTRALEARAVRQNLISRPDGPQYSVIIDEVALRRAPAPVEILRAQLDHIVDLGHHHQNLTIQILPVDEKTTRIPGSAFSCYVYPDPDDPAVVAVDTITSDLVLLSTDREQEVRSYNGLYEHLSARALSPPDSLDLLTVMAEELTNKPERHEHERAPVRQLA